MKKTVNVRNIILGQGMPKICVPVTGTTYEAVTDQMKKIHNEYRDAVDVIELRIDFFENVFDEDRLLELLKKVRQIISDMALLFTFRTKKEGGEREISSEKYKSLVKTAIDSGMVDAVDVEAFFDDSILKELSAYAKAKKIPVIASNHDFEKTPERSDISERLKYMENQGADIAKIAVMPQSKKDVSVLMSALCDADESLEIPVIAISMGKLGAVSRIAGEVFGSCLTFGVADKASAPGQIDVKELKKTLELLQL